MSRPGGVADLLITGAAEVLTCSPRGDDPLGRVTGGVVAVAGERIVAVGSRAEVEAACDARAAEVVDAGGGLVTPGFVDCHTPSSSADPAPRNTRRRPPAGWMPSGAVTRRGSPPRSR